jgi:hypothetical protein
MFLVDLHDCRHLTCELRDAVEEAAEDTALVEASMPRLVSVVVAFWAAAKARSPKVATAVKKRILMFVCAIVLG